MAQKKIDGQWYKMRGSNHKYTVLDDLDFLFERLKIKSRDELAKELGVPYNSLNYRIQRYFPEEWIKQIKIKRKHQ